MNLLDIIALAKQGFKPADIRELIEIGKGLETEPAPAAGPEPAPEPAEPAAPAEPDFDYAAEISKLKAENEKIMKDLKAAQEQNRSTPANIPEEKPMDERLKDIARAIMR